MATFVFTDPYLTIGGTDLSDHVKSVTLNYQADLHDVTAGGDDTHTRLGGLKDWSLEVEFYQDYAASNVDATLWPLVGTTAALVLRADSAAASATNPQYSGTGILEGHTPVGGSIGDVAMTSVTFQAAGTLARATS